MLLCVCHMYHIHICGCYSDPYVKVSFKGPVSVFPHFTTISNDPVPDFYKTRTIQKVHHDDHVIICATIYYWQTLNPHWNSGFKFSVSC